MSKKEVKNIRKYGYGFSGEILKDKRQPLWEKQRRKRGFDDTETWNFYLTLAKFILPRLKRFKDINPGYPSSITMEEWDTILQEMIDGFELVIKGKDIDASQTYEEYRESDNIKEQKVNRALELLKEWFWDLWW